MYFFGTVSTKASVIVAANGEPLFARANPQAGRLAQMLPGSPPPRIRPVFGRPRSQGGGKNARKGSFRPEKRNADAVLLHPGRELRIPTRSNRRPAGLRGAVVCEDGVETGRAIADYPSIWI